MIGDDRNKLLKKKWIEKQSIMEHQIRENNKHLQKVQTVINLIDPMKTKVAPDYRFEQICLKYNLNSLMKVT